MALSAGTSLGPYEILSPLGAGGMGKVYRARDARLGRDVAVKVLPDEVANDPGALARFEREARAVAALSHPNILALHDVGEASGVRYLVTELLQGETLRAALRDGALPVKRALETAEQVARGLAAAHEKGIVHRDLKPENVFVARDGHVKILDFGLARRHDLLPDANDTLAPTAPVETAPGAVVGTIAYMSPEQARGETAGFASDQFSLGVVLYEMLSGRRPFRGASGAETFSAILRDEPEPLETLAPSVPAPVRWIVGRCLQKEPAERYGSTRDLARDLATWRLHLPEASSSAGSAVPIATRPRARARIALAALVASALALAVVFAFLFVRERQRPRPTAGRFEVRLPEGHFLDPSRNAVALSPDGTLLVFSAWAWKRPYEEQDERRLFLRRLDSLEVRPIPGSESGVQPVFSPDGRHLAFVTSSEGKPFLRRVPVAGGPVQTICACDASFGAAWSPDGSILFASGTGPLQRVAASGGTPEPVTTLDAAAQEVSHRLPHLLPDGRTVLYTSLRWTTVDMTWAKARIYASRLGERDRTLLVEGGSDGRWAPPGVLLFAREGKLFAAPLGSGARGLTGKPAPVLDGIRHVIWWGADWFNTGAAQVDAASDGLLAWFPGSVTPPYVRSLAWVDASGKEVPLEGGPTTGPVLGGRISPDGQRVLLTYNYPGMQAEVVDLVRRARRRVTFGANPIWAIWGPGPDRITFTSDHEGPVALYTRRLEAGPEEIEPLWKPSESAELCLGSWSRDGKVLAFNRCPRTGSCAIWLLEPGKEPRPFGASTFQERWPDVSPDGQWLLYTSDAPGHPEVFARPLSGQGDTLQVSAGEGQEPHWSRDGASVYYRRPVEGKAGHVALFRVRVTKVAGSLAFAVPERLFAGAHSRIGPGHSWDVGPDGSFLMVKSADQGTRALFWDKHTSNRIVVDTGGVARLMAEAKTGP